MRLYTKEDDIYINIQSNMINNIDEDNILLKEYIRIYKNVEKLKEYIIKYLFEKDSSLTQKNIGDLLLNIKSEENLDKFINYIDVDIHSLEEKFKNLIKKPLDAIKSLVVSFDPNDNTFSLSLEEKDLYKTNNLTQSLTDVFTSLGEAAAKAEIPICFFIDEIQYIKSENLGALIAAIHRTNQLGYPIMIIAAGLPKIYSMLSSEKSYSERLFIYKEIDSLEREQAIKAIEMTIKQFNVKYCDKAINKIIEVTEGYPFFIQQLCQIVFQNVDSKVISDIDVENNLEEFFEKLDTGFFKLRYERCSAAEKKFIFAMVKCGELPCTIANIAEIMKKSINSISTARAQLINKGIIYPVKYRELDFTVPQFSGFIHRLEEYKQWDTI